METTLYEDLEKRVETLEIQIKGLSQFVLEKLTTPPKTLAEQIEQDMDLLKELLKEDNDNG